MDGDEDGKMVFEPAIQNYNELIKEARKAYSVCKNNKICNNHKKVVSLHSISQKVGCIFFVVIRFLVNFSRF